MVETQLNELLSTAGLSDLTINGHLFAFANVDGNWRQVPSPFPSEAALIEFATNLATVARKRLDFGCPFADIAVGSLRYHLALPITGGKFHMSIRKHQSNRLGLGELLESPGRWTSQLQAIVQSKANFLISGGTGSGKTTLLRAMLELDRNQRVITVEDVAELELSIPNLVSLQTRQANSDGAGQIDLQRLVLESLRMKPDRIVVGEVRGAELVPMLQALNSGHRGSATSIHANRAEDVPARLVGIGLLGGLSPATTSHLASSAFDYVISLAPRSKNISISAIAKLELTRESRLVTRVEQ
jgi:pilus assembly protein CpaF